MTLLKKTVMVDNGHGDGDRQCSQISLHQPSAFPSLAGRSVQVYSVEANATPQACTEWMRGEIHSPYRYSVGENTTESILVV